MKVSRLALSSVILLVCVASTAHAEWIRLGSWNIEHLGKNDEGTGPKALAEYIHLSGVDVLAMQEIYDNDKDRNTRTNTQLTQAFEILNEIDGYDWTYEMLGNKSKRDTTQLVAVAWNREKMTKVGETMRIPIDRAGKEWDRHPHAIKLSAGEGRTDIVVIPLHMKADYRGDFSDQRGLEARELAGQLEYVRGEFEDEDVVIIGDLNCGDAGEPALHVFAGAGFKDLNAHDAPTHIKWGPLDRVLIPDQEEFRYSRQYIIAAADSESFDQYLSDHQVIVVPIRVLADDDPS